MEISRLKLCSLTLGVYSSCKKKPHKIVTATDDPGHEWKGTTIEILDSSIFSKNDFEEVGHIGI